MLNIFKKDRYLRSFEELIDISINQIAKNYGCSLIPNEKLLKNSSAHISYAFTGKINSKYKLINILLLPHSIKFTEKLEEHLILLRDYILAKDCMLIVIYEQILENEKIDHVSEFLLETYDLCSNNYYTIPFYQKYHKNIFDEIASILNGTIYFYGPKIGRQIANIEIVSDTCWKCNKSMMTVTGLVFPNKRLDTWNNTTWRYYLQSIPIISIPNEYINLISSKIEDLRESIPSITSIKYKYSHFVKEKYWAACCPYCDSLRGNNYVQELMMTHLHDINSRLSPDLVYSSLEIDIRQDLLNVLYGGGFDTSEHSCDAGWRKK